MLVQINKSVSTPLNAAMGSLTVVMDQTNNAVSPVVDRSVHLVILYMGLAKKCCSQKVILNWKANSLFKNVENKLYFPRTAVT